MAALGEYDPSAKLARVAANELAARAVLRAPVVWDTRTPLIYGFRRKYGPIRYVGQTTQKLRERMYGHLNMALHLDGTAPICWWLRKYAQDGVDGIEIVVLEVAENEDDLDDLEIKWIEHYKTYTADGYGGVNNDRGGHAPRGRKLSAESVAKRNATRRANGGYEVPEYRRQMLRDLKLGRKDSAEVAAKKGKNLSFALHVRWHVNRLQPKLECTHCTAAVALS